MDRKGFTDYDWYLPTPVSAAAAEETQSAHEQDIAAMKAAVARFGAETAATRGGRIDGLIFENNIAPDGWGERGHIKGRPFFFPKKISKALRAAAAEIDALELPGMDRFSDRFGGAHYVGGEAAVFNGRSFYMRGAVFHRIGDTLLIGKPIGVDDCLITVPVGRSVPMSEVFAMLEVA